MITENLWTSSQNSSLPPFSFLLDGVPASEFLSGWTRGDNSQNGQTIVALPSGKAASQKIFWRDPQSGLQVCALVRELNDSGALEWVLEFWNDSEKASGLIENILPLDISRSTGAGEKVVLHHANGSLCQMDDFLFWSTPLGEGEFALEPVGGRSSDGGFPFFNLQFSGGGAAIAIGWTGQWRAAWNRDEISLRISAGMEKTRLRLEPGERIRTPSILIAPWNGDDASAGNNLLRRLLLEHFCPRINGELWIPPVAHMTMSDFHHTGVTSEAIELKALKRAHELGIEAFWVDACWYGEGGKWFEEVGNWQVNTQFFPRGLKPIGDAAHERGMKFVLWFEPERVRNNTPIFRAHPEWLLRQAPLEEADENAPENALFNLGLPDARAFMTDMISGVISEAGVDIYRQDFNFRPLEFWQAADAPDRIGISEIRHIEGLYAMWDELRARHPNLCIDNCASGGRRIDLETTARSIPLWRSDFSDVGGPAFGRGLQVGDQMQTAGLSRWVPFHTAAVWTFSPYEFRSAMASGVVFYCNIQKDNFPADAARAGIAELKRLRPFYCGDFYSLSPLTLAYHDWCCYQYHRPDLDAGFALFLRRHESPFTKLEVALEGVNADAQYQVEMYEDFDEPIEEILSGAQLKQLAIAVAASPGALLLEYRRAPSA